MIRLFIFTIKRRMTAMEFSLFLSASLNDPTPWFLDTLSIKNAPFFLSDLSCTCLHLDTREDDMQGEELWSKVALILR